MVPFPSAFKEHWRYTTIDCGNEAPAIWFESSWKKPYSDRGVRRLLERYATAAGLP